MTTPAPAARAPENTHVRSSDGDQPLLRAEHPASILVVDDDPFVRDGLADILTFAGYDVVEAADGKAALDMLLADGETDPVDVVLLDLEMPRRGGLDVLRELNAVRPGTPVVIISGRGTIGAAVEATKLGAYDFLEKPVDAHRTLLTVRNALGQSRLRRERDDLLSHVRSRYRMVGADPSMQAIYELIDRAARAPSKVLVTGESGTGKERVARAIHLNSVRATGPFVAVNCAALPGELVESELFGHERGSFTGAHARREGAFEQASGGTLFLDEIGDMSLTAQSKVLRTLEEGTVRRVGGSREIPVDVRVIAATHQDLREAAARGEFREDLYWRLNVVAIHLPPLRARADDVPALAEHFRDEIVREHGHGPRRFTRAAIDLLRRQPWPGNVRELRNVVERIVVLSDGAEVGAPEVLSVLRSGAGFDDPVGVATSDELREARAEFERAHIQRILEEHDGHISNTAAALGIDRSHLWKKMQQLGVEGGEG